MSVRFHVRHDWGNPHYVQTTVVPFPDPLPRVFRTTMLWKFYPRRPNLAGWALTLWLLRFAWRTR